MRVLILMFPFALAGCAATFEAPPRPIIEERVQDDQPRALCLVRARLFKGLVAVRCSDLAQEFRP